VAIAATRLRLRLDSLCWSRAAFYIRQLAAPKSQQPVHPSTLTRPRCPRARNATDRSRPHDHGGAGRVVRQRPRRPACGEEVGVDQERGRRAEGTGAAERPAELGEHQRRAAGAQRQVVPPPVVPAPLPRGRCRPTLHAAGGRGDRRAPAGAPQQVGHNLGLPPRPHRQRRQEPLELGPPEAAGAGRQGAHAVPPGARGRQDGAPRSRPGDLRPRAGRGGRRRVPPAVPAGPWGHRQRQREGRRAHGCEMRRGRSAHRVEALPVVAGEEDEGGGVTVDGGGEVQGGVDSAVLPQFMLFFSFFFY
jgi:hypothetical protein